MIERNDICWCGSGLKWKKCHHPIGPKADFATLSKEYKKRYGIILKTPEEIAGIRKACELAATILDEVCAMAEAGVTTNTLNDYAHKRMIGSKAIPATLGYGSPPYPKSLCTSLNEVICHGIPNDTPLKEGDIVNIDLTCILNGYYGDCSKMVMIGKVDAEKQRVVDVSYQCLMRSIAVLKPGVALCEIGKVIEEYAALHDCSVVNQFVGHGVGIDFHEPPQVPHHYNTITTPLTAGMTFTIEPMINAGVRTGVIDSKDKWTVRTLDGKPSAQWEHTILITPTGHEVLTKWSRK